MIVPTPETGMRVEWSSYASPIGALTIAEADAGTLLVEFAAVRTGSHWQERLRAASPRVRIEFGSCAVTRAWLDDYFAGTPSVFPFPYHLGRWYRLSSAAVVVSRALWEIPFAETRSYDDVARATGLNPRMIGQLVGANHLALCIPCHRVVGKDGGLVGYGGGIPKKRWLLDHELRSVGLVLR